MLQFSVTRPIFITMSTLLAVLLGLVALARLPIDLMPELTYPTLTVSTTYTNAGPEEVEQLISRPIEDVVTAVQGVEEITSISQEGSSSVRISFVWGTDLDVASNDVRDRLERIIRNLPEEADAPQIRKFDSTARPIMIIGMAGNIDQKELRFLADEQISQRLSRVAGVATVDVWGGREREIQINIRPDRLQALGLSLEDVRQSLRDANITLPAGQIETGRYEINLRIPGEFTSLRELARTPIATRNNQTIYLEQISNIVDGHVKLTRIVRINGQEGVRLAVRKQSDANTVEAARGVKAELERLRAQYPNITLVPVVDNSVFIERAIANVSNSVVLGGALAVFILLFFLRQVSATLVVATAIPVSVISTFALLFFGGMTLNMMTLGGLALGVGLMVDSAIVVLENIARRRTENNEDEKTAAIKGAQEVAGAIIACTVTTLVVFLPMLFAQELAGVMFRQLTYVIAFSLTASSVVALTLVPMLSARFLRHSFFANRSERALNIYNRMGTYMDKINSGYQKLLDVTLNSQRTTLGIVLGLLAISMALFPLVGREFMPRTDEGEVRVSIEMEPGTRLELLNQRMVDIEKRVLPAVPEAIAWVSQVGGSQFRSASPATGEIQITLVPQSARNRSSAEIAADIRKLLADLPGAEVRTREGQGLFRLQIGGNDDESLTLEIRGFDLAALDSVANDLMTRLKPVPGITDMRISRPTGVPEYRLTVNRARAADLGVSVAAIARTIEVAIAGGTAGVFREDGDEFDIRVQLENAEQLSLDQVLDLVVPSSRGNLIALRNLITPEEARGPTQIERRNQQRIMNLLVNIADRNLSDVVADINTTLNSMSLPRNIEVVLSGDYEAQQDTFREMILALLLAVVLMYMVLACLYESLLDPLLVMVAVPLAIIGVIFMLLATSTTLNAQSFIGCIMLVGIVVNNAILLVEQASTLRRDEGYTAAAAAREAGRRRLRPILMTAGSTLLAMIPLALGIGEGAEAQAPLARAVIGGLFSSTVTVLVVIPTLYIYAYRRHDKAPATPSEAPSAQA